MRCNNCRGDRFVRSEYRLPSGHAPALECVHCHTLNLDEDAARSQEERDSVRLAQAARAACSNDPL